MKRCVLVALLLIAPGSSAFDGQRQGFVLGGGIGFSPNTTWSIGNVVFGPQPFGPSQSSGSEQGLSVRFLIGHAWNEFNQVAYENNLVIYKSQFFDQTLIQGIHSLALTHYLGPPGKSIFCTGGIGLYLIDGSESRMSEPGIGFLVGGGYEFHKHFQAGVYLSIGESYPDDLYNHLTHRHISFVLSSVIY
jgi:hypothetical protein